MPKITAQNATQVIGRSMLVDVVPIIIDLDKSKGNRIFDAKDQKAYLDCFSYIASNPIGHNHPKMLDKDFEKKLLRAARAKPSSSDFHTVEMAEFVDAFFRIAQPKEFPHVFFITGGALAVENALKTAFDWKVRLNHERGVKDKGTQIIHFKQAFHGRSGYTMSLTNTADPRKVQYYPKFQWPRITNPKITFPLEGENLRAVIDAEKQAVAEIEQAFADNPGDIAGIVIEPIQGEGGDNHFRPEFHRTLRRLADENEAMLIYDEVQAGIGLTGRMWAYQNYGIVPDIVSFGKKAQVCGIMSSCRVEDVGKHVFEEKSRLNSTWGGALVDMVRSQRYLEIIEEENLVKNAKEVGEYFLQALGEITQRHPHIFNNPRGKGLMCALSLVSEDKRNAVWDEMFKRGVLVLKSAKDGLRFRPSLTFARSDVDELISVLEDSL